MEICEKRPELYIAFILIFNSISDTVLDCAQPLTQFATKMTKDIPKTRCCGMYGAISRPKMWRGSLLPDHHVDNCRCMFYGPRNHRTQDFPRHLHHIRQRMFEAHQQHREQYDDIPSEPSRVFWTCRVYAVQSEAVMVYMPYIIGLIVVIVYTFSRAVPSGQPRPSSCWR